MLRQPHAVTHPYASCKLYAPPPVVVIFKKSLSKLEEPLYALQCNVSYKRSGSHIFTIPASMPPPLLLSLRTPKELNGAYFLSVGEPGFRRSKPFTTLFFGTCECP